MPENDLTSAFKNQAAGIEVFLKTITEEKSVYAYAEGKWTIKEMLQHITDTERIFCYRALCFARGEKINLPGFEENDYAVNSHANRRNWESLRCSSTACIALAATLFATYRNSSGRKNSQN